MSRSLAPVMPFFSALSRYVAPRIAVVITALITALITAMSAGCASGPASLIDTRLPYNEAIKVTSEQQLLLNIVRLRYTDTPSSLTVASVTAQFELVKQLQLTPFFSASGAEPNRSFTAVLPQAGISYADRPTISLVPIDDAEFTRKLFTPLTVDGVLYLAKTTWPISTVFRLYLENINWVPNAELASGPTPRLAPPYSSFLRGVEALGKLQAEGQIVFGTQERFDPVSDSIPAAKVDAMAVIEAAKSGFEFRFNKADASATLGKRVRQPMLFIDPKALESPVTKEFVSAFQLKPGRTRYDLTAEDVEPFSSTEVGAYEVLDIEPRSLLQAMYFISHGVHVPPEHLQSGIARTTFDRSGNVFDWQPVTAGLFQAHWSKGDAPPPANAHVSVRYQNYWFYIPGDDHETKATFSLLMELSRLDLQTRAGDKPVLTLPIGR